jgi:NDP-sugar pyrophosphorylase family protein
VIKVCNNNPKSVNENYRLDEVKHLMVTLLIECIPVVKDDKQISEVLTWEQVFVDKHPIQKGQLDLPVVVMAGGKGTRLDPFTRVLPKPLIPINDKPIIEIIMDKFGEYGVKEFYLSVNHKSRMIRSYFEEVNDRYTINYIEEEEPLGTAGSLRSLVDRINDSVLVVNCDTIIESDYNELVKFHNDKGNDLTLVVSLKHYVIPFGVCEIENGGELKEIKEKPESDLLVNTGMYVIRKRALKIIPENQFFNITDLIEKCKKQGHKVGVFPISDKCWIDIGHWDEYQNAIEKMRIK